ncbi:MAG: hypothetical protein QF449_13000 [Alphaproteobacteria bacterium]|jgi:hypothetical protein|nr:hypothetical protein [Alphaproteobacteria bacterium]
MAAATGREAICHCESYVDGCMPVVAMPNAEDLTRRLADLLSDPRETLGVELKVWLDIVDNAEHKAILAKAIIALANHGGGHVIFGFT